MQLARSDLMFNNSSKYSNSYQKNGKLFQIAITLQRHDWTTSLLHSKNEQSVQQWSDLFSKPSNNSPADRPNEQMIPDSFMVCCDCTWCNMKSESSIYFYLGLGNLCHSRPLHPRKSAMKFGFGQSDRWHRGAVTAMPFPSINRSPTPPLHHSLHLTISRGSMLSQKRDWHLAQSSVNTLRSRHLQQGRSVTCVKEASPPGLGSNLLAPAMIQPDLSEGVTRCWVT